MSTKRYLNEKARETHKACFLIRPGSISSACLFSPLSLSLSTDFFIGQIFHRLCVCGFVSHSSPLSLNFSSLTKVFAHWWMWKHRSCRLRALVTLPARIASHFVMLFADLLFDCLAGRNAARVQLYSGAVFSLLSRLIFCVRHFCHLRMKSESSVFSAFMFTVLTVTEHV